jgi:hypothetical protein
MYDDAIRTGDRMRGYIKQYVLIKLMFRCKFRIWKYQNPIAIKF